MKPLTFLYMYCIQAPIPFLTMEEVDEIKEREEAKKMAGKRTEETDGEVSNKRFFEEKAKAHQIAYERNADLDGDGVDERIVFVNYNVKTSFIGGVYCTDIYIEKKNESGEYVLVYESSDDETHAWVRVAFDSYIVGNRSTIEAVEGKNYLVNDTGKSAILYAFDSERNELVLFYEYAFLNEEKIVELQCADGEDAVVNSSQTSSIGETEASGHVQNASFKNISKLSYEEARAVYYNLEDARKYEVLGSKEQSEADFIHRLHSIFQFSKDSAEEEETVFNGLKDLSWMPNKTENKERIINRIESEVIPFWETIEGCSFRVFLCEAELGASSDSKT